MTSNKFGAYSGNIYAVIISYYPDPGQLQRLLRALASQVSHSIVVNNGPAIRLPELESTDQTSLLESGSNIGVAAAINLGIATAVRAGADHVLLFDQDSLPDGGMVSSLFNAYMQLKARGYQISAVGPSVVDRSSGRTVPFVCISQQVVEDEITVCPVEMLLSSGSFIEIDSYRQIGPMDEGLFIDLVDTEWCLRAASMGYQAFGVPSAYIYHQLGGGTVKFWCGRWFYFPQHGLFRYYYMFRNRILLFPRSYIPLVRRWHEFWVMIYLLTVGFVLLPQRGMRLKMVVHGVFDGLRGRGGKAPFPHYSAR